LTKLTKKDTTSMAMQITNKNRGGILYYEYINTNGKHNQADSRFGGDSYYRRGDNP
jgi:hypothetical protein